MPITNIENFRGGLSLVDPSNIEDNQFEVLSNMNYNKDKRVQTRGGVKNFGNAIGSDPITSHFFYQNDTTGLRTLLATAGTNMYLYDEGTGDWNSIKSGLTQYEADGVTLTRWSFAVYLNIIYVANGVDAYASYDPATDTYTERTAASEGTATFTNSTNLVNMTGHSITEGESVKFTTTGTLPTELTVGRYYYVINVNANDFQLALTPGGSAVTFTDDGTATTTAFTLSQPRVRYLRYMADSIYGSGEDLNPSTIYATTAGAANANSINSEDIKVGGDELGKINGMLDLGNILLVFKDKKIYSVSGDLSTSEAIDAQNGGYSHRSLRNVENAIMYYSDSGVDRVKPRNGVVGATAMSTEPLSDDLRSQLDLINPTRRNTSSGYYNTTINNYYFSFDTGNDGTNDTLLVYSSLVGAWSQYVMPPISDYSIYIDSDGAEHILASSANGGQMYELEVDFQDFGAAIDTELKTKRWDFGNVGQWKTFDHIDITGLKNEGAEITVEIIVDEEIVASSIIDDSFIDITGQAVTIGNSPIGLNQIGGATGISSTSGIDLYQYLIRIPLYDSGPNVQVRMYSDTNPNVWTLDNLKISREDEVIDFFATANIG